MHACIACTTTVHHSVSHGLPLSELGERLELFPFAPRHSRQLGKTPAARRKPIHNQTTMYRPLIPGAAWPARWDRQGVQCCCISSTSLAALCCASKASSVAADPLPPHARCHLFPVEASLPKKPHAQFAAATRVQIPGRACCSGITAESVEVGSHLDPVEPKFPCLLDRCLSEEPGEIQRSQPIQLLTREILPPSSGRPRLAP